MKKVAVHIPSDGPHPTHWSTLWLRLNDPRFKFEKINLLDCDLQSVANNFDCILWCVDHYRREETELATSIIDFFESNGLKTFPTSKDLKLFDDKAYQSLIMSAKKISTPKFHLYYSKNQALKFSKDTKYPIVVKLKRGSGSQNVSLIKNRRELNAFINKIFSKGIKSSPRIGFKVWSQTQSAKSIGDVLSRVKKIPGFIKNLKISKSLPVERGYIYAQEWIENSGYDIKVVIVNGKLTAFGRKVRKGDFRASGSGDIIHDDSIINNKIISTAINAYDALELSCVGFDFVIDSNNNTPYIIEMCFGFSNEAALAFGKYYDIQNKVWVNRPLDASLEVLDYLE